MIKFEKHTADDKDRKITKNVFSENVQMLKQLFFYLQYSSPTYPSIDLETLYNKFVSKLVLPLTAPCSGSSDTISLEQTSELVRALHTTDPDLSVTKNQLVRF